MFSLFKSKRRKYPAEPKWAVLKGQYQGKPIIVRRNESAKDLLGSQDYKYRVGVAVPLLHPNASGLPSHDEIEILNQIEDELIARLEHEQMALQVLAITTNGMREFVFYSRDTNNIEPILHMIRPKYSSHQIQSYFKEDRDWNIYKEFDRKF